MNILQKIIGVLLVGFSFVCFFMEKEILTGMALGMFSMMGIMMLMGILEFSKSKNEDG